MHKLHRKDKGKSISNNNIKSGAKEEYRNINQRVSSDIRLYLNLKVPWLMVKKFKTKTFLLLRVSNLRLANLL